MLEQQYNRHGFNMGGMRSTTPDEMSFCRRRWYHLPGKRLDDDPLHQIPYRRTTPFLTLDLSSCNSLLLLPHLHLSPSLAYMNTHWPLQIHTTNL